MDDVVGLVLESFETGFDSGGDIACFSLEVLGSGLGV
jgi:hypothetical protein